MRLQPPSNPQKRFSPQDPHRGGKGNAPLFRQALLLLVCLVAIELAPAAEPASRAAETFLRRVKGLSNIPGGKVWLGRAEQTLRDCLASLDEARREVLQLQKSLEQSVQRNYQHWEANRQTIDTLKAALSKTVTDAPERKKIQQQLQRLQSEIIAPERLAAQSDVRRRLIQFTNARNRLALQILAVRRSLPQMDEEYRRLGADLEVHAALRALGEGHRLGPLEAYREEQRRLVEYEQIVFTPWLPVYLQSERIRVGAILNETTPVTFTWRPESGPTVLTTSMIEAAGLAPPTAETAVPLPVASGRTLLARRITVPAIRFGQVVLRDAPVYVLGPDGEDLGATIGPDAFTDADVKIELERLRLVIKSRSQSRAASIVRPARTGRSRAAVRKTVSPSGMFAPFGRCGTALLGRDFQPTALDLIYSPSEIPLR